MTYFITYFYSPSLEIFPNEGVNIGCFLVIYGEVYSRKVD